MSDGNDVYIGGVSGNAIIQRPTIKVGFNTSDTWVCPSNVTKIYVQLWGAGGGGGGGSGLNTNNECMAWTGLGYWGSKGGIGGSGGYYADSISVVPGNVYNVNIGIGGTGGNRVSCGTGQTGVTGGSTDFHSILTAPGGTGGIGYLSNNGNTAPFGFLNGSQGSIDNWIYPSGPIPIASYIPTDILTVTPGFANGGSGGQEARVNSPGTQNSTSGGAGADGFCIISY